jgi:uncharacterized OB-fold protein
MAAPIDPTEPTLEPTMGGTLPEDWALPALSDLNRPWFTSGTLAVQACVACHARQHPPEELCRRCGSLEFTHEVLAPAGTIHSYTVAHYPVNRALGGSVPYAVVLVTLDEDPSIRVVGNLRGVPLAEIRIGMAVEAVWDERVADDGDVVLLPNWEPA